MCSEPPEQLINGALCQSESTEQFWSFTVKQCPAKQLKQQRLDLKKHFSKSFSTHNLPADLINLKSQVPFLTTVGHLHFCKRAKIC